MSRILVTKAEPWNQLSQGKDILITGCQMIQCLRNADYEIVNRTGGLEEDTSYRQYCTYCLVQDMESGDYLVATRKPKQTESRLHGKKYLGIGGHIEECDIRPSNGSLSDTVVNSSCRELEEEVGIQLNHIINGFTQGIIVTHSCGVVDQVHIGIMCHIIVDKGDVNLDTEEVHLHDAAWKSLSDLIIDYSNNKDSYEGWTQLIMNCYITTNSPLGI